MGILNASTYGGYVDPLERTASGYRTSNPVVRAGRAASPGDKPGDAGLGFEVRVQARLQALKEMLAALDPEDFIGKNLIENEMGLLEAQLSKDQAGINQRIGAINEQMLHAQAQEAMLQEGKELASLSPLASEWTGVPSGYSKATEGQYGAVVPNAAYINEGRPGETGEYSPKGVPQYDWMKGVVTGQGLRPLLGDYALDPTQQRMTALQQTWNEYGKPKTIEQWLEVKPNVELVMEQWRLATEKSKPKRVYNGANWLAAAAR